MSESIAKTYEPKTFESAIYQKWLEKGCFTADPGAAGEPYCIVIPPPNVTGALHLGHAINNTLQDILIRHHRMRGFNTLWVPGIDHAGIATQAVVEKQLKEKENKTRHDVGRDGLVERIWKWKEQFGNQILEQLKRLGCSCDWTRTHFTLDDQCATAVRETFFKLFKDRLIYRGKRLVNWDVHLQTSISDDEIYHETVKTSLWHIKYPISGTDKFVTVATTRPETMLGDTAVAVHSADPRWNWAIGKMVDLPLTGRKIPIIADDILVDPKFGSGVVKVTPAHDPNDYAVWQRHQGKPDQIDLINILNPDGTLNENAGSYRGMKREPARKKVVEDLIAQNLLEKEEPYETQVGHSDRSKTSVEPYLSDQWFVEMAKLAEPALEAVRNGSIKFAPERHAQTYLSWLGEKRDWPISRQLWWGHRIPVWSKQIPRDAIGKDLQLDAKNQPMIPLRIRFNFLSDSEYASSEAVETGGAWHICVPPNNIAIENKLKEQSFVQDPDVLDTWFSSGLWPHSTLGWPEQTPDLKKWYPTNVLLTGRDIVTLWVARMVMLGLYNMNDIPFRHVVINPTILDGKGERMSKSKGNGVDPVEIIDLYGADALRFTLAHMATETQDVRMPVKKDAQGRNTSEKFDLGSRFCNKIWQVANFLVIANLEKIAPEPVDEKKWSLADRWIVSRFNRAVQAADESLAHYRFDQYAKTCYDFFYGDFCDWYVETAKPALRNSTTAGQTANILAAVLDGSLRLLHPVTPFITEEIWSHLNKARQSRGLPNRLDCPPTDLLIKAPWPHAAPADKDAEKLFGQIQEIITAIRALRNDHKVEPKKSVDVSIEAPAPIIAHIQNNPQIVELLATCRLVKAAEKLAEIPNAVRVAGPAFTLFIAGLIDEDAEKHRVAKRKEDLAKQIQTLQARLANESYTARAPAHLVQQTRDQLTQAQTELEKLGPGTT
jgi:valyl-tRNA synthetase